LLLVHADGGAFALFACRPPLPMVTEAGALACFTLRPPLPMNTRSLCGLDRLARCLPSADHHRQFTGRINLRQHGGCHEQHQGQHSPAHPRQSEEES